MADDPIKKLADRVTTQQDREARAHAERKKHIAKTPEILEAFAARVDHQQPAPTPRG